MMYGLQQLVKWAPEQPHGGGADKPVMKTSEQLKKEVVEVTLREIKANPVSAGMEVKNMVDTAKKKIAAMPDLDEQLKGEVLKRLDGGVVEFIVLAEDLKAKTKLMVDLLAMKPDQAGFDFAKAEKFLGDAKVDVEDWANEYATDDVVIKKYYQKVQEVSNAANNKYVAMSAGLRDVSQSDGAFSASQVERLLKGVYDMQGVLLADLPGVMDASLKQNLRAELARAESEVVTVLAAHLSDLKGDQAEAAKRFLFARTNLIEAGKDGNKDHLAGANEYMEMALAEREAAGWRDQLDGARRGGEVYGKALRLFEQAGRLMGNRKIGDSKAARDLYRQAADQWKLLVEAQNLVVNSREMEKLGQKAVKALNAASMRVEQRAEDLGLQQLFKVFLTDARDALKVGAFDTVLKLSQQIQDMVAGADRANVVYAHLSERFGNRADFKENMEIGRGRNFYHMGQFAQAELAYNKAIKEYVIGGKKSEGPMMAAR